MKWWVGAGVYYANALGTPPGEYDHSWNSKGTTKGPHTSGDIMVWNLKQREEHTKCGIPLTAPRARESFPSGQKVTGVAWKFVSINSCRECWVKIPQRHEALLLVPSFSWALWDCHCVLNRRKVGMTSNHHATCCMGYTIQWLVQRVQSVTAS